MSFDKPTIQILHRFCQIPIRVFDMEWNLLETFSNHQTVMKKYELNKFEELKEDSRDKDYCFLAYEKNVPIGICCCRGEDVYYILGPIAYGKIDDFFNRTFLKKHSIRECPNVQLDQLHALAAYLICRKIDDDQNQPDFFSDFGTDSESITDLLTNEELRQIDAFQTNHTYMDEMAWFSHIRSGDVKYMEQQAFSETPFHPVLMDNLMKNEEYIAAISISLAARAAIEGGVSSSEAFLHNDIYLKKLASCKNVMEVIQLKRESQQHFTRLVWKHRKNNTTNIHVEKVKKYIASHRFEPASLQEIADEIGLSKDYLQKIFKQYEGIPITEYISDMRMEAACNMLIYSDRKISEIAEYLHYGSSSHFSVAFHKKMNMSPRDYREQNKKITF